MDQTIATTLTTTTRIADSALELVRLTQLTTQFLEERTGLEFSAFNNLLSFANSGFENLQEKRLN